MPDYEQCFIAVLPGLVNIIFLSEFRCIKIDILSSDKKIK